MLCLLIILSATAVYSNYNYNHNYNLNYPNWYYTRSHQRPNPYNYYNIRDNTLELAVCQKFCYRVNCFGEIEWNCCDFNDKEGSCPSNCLFGNRKLNYRNIHCSCDSECPPDYKCCTDACYTGSKICRRSVTNYCPSSPAITRATTLSPKTTEEFTRATTLRLTTPAPTISSTRATTPSTTTEELTSATTPELTTTKPTTERPTTRRPPTTTEDVLISGSGSGSGDGDDEGDDDGFGSGSGFDDGDLEIEVESPSYEDDLLDSEEFEFLD